MCIGSGATTLDLASLLLAAIGSAPATISFVSGSAADVLGVSVGTADVALLLLAAVFLVLSSRIDVL